MSVVFTKSSVRVAQAMVLDGLETVCSRISQQILTGNLILLPL